LCISQQREFYHAKSFCPIHSRYLVPFTRATRQGRTYLLKHFLPRPGRLFTDNYSSP
jgi:hypothetical protein